MVVLGSTGLKWGLTNRITCGLTGMGNIDGGYIILARNLFEGAMMDKPDLYLKLWVWMLYKANWKDRGRLKRGQFVTSIREMQEAMSYYIGYRKKHPTRDQIRSSYEYFVKALMITTTKTTRGMIVTILNYNKYQDPRQYEAHQVSLGEGVMVPHTTPQETEERKAKKKEYTDNSAEQPGDKPKKCSDEQWEKYRAYSREVLERQRDSLGKIVKVTEASVLAGAKALDGLVRIDGYDPKGVYETIEWALQDSFWDTQVRSLGSLRDKSRNGESKFSNIWTARFSERRRVA